MQVGATPLDIAERRYRRLARLDGQLDMTIKAAIYCRISLDVTGEGLGVQRQEQDCRAIAEARGWQIVEVYTDNSASASKKNGKRPEYDRLVSDFQQGRFNALLAWDLDRLTRQPRQLEDWIDAAEERGLILVTANGEADLCTDAGRLFARIKASVARAEIERKAARQKRAAAQRAELGKVPAGVRLTGYTIKGEIVPEEAELVRAIFSRFVAGDSLKGITAWLRAEGHQTRNGRPWNPSTTRTILTNPRYAGRAVYCGQALNHRGLWEPLVDEATFDVVQQRLSDPRRITNRVGTHRRYLGSGLFLCGVCDQPVSSFSGNRYRCREAHVIRMTGSVDRLILKLLKARLAQSDVADLLAEPDDAELEALSEDITALRRRLEAIEGDYDAGLIDGRRYATASAKVTADLQKLEKERAQLVGGQGLAAILTAPDPVAAFDEAPLGIKRTVLGALLTVKLMPWVRGRKFRPESVRVKWRGQARFSAVPADLD